MIEQQNYTYKKTEWKNDETHLNASNMNNMEYGIDLSVRTSSQNAKNIQDHNDKINILNGTEETEGSVKKAVKDAKKEVIGVYSKDFPGNQRQTIASTVEYFQGEVTSLNTEINAQGDALQLKIDAATSRIDSKAGELQANIDALSKNSSDNFNAHVNNKNNPHEVTASQLNVYTKQESDSQKKDVENQIKAAQSTAFLEVDKSEEMVEDADGYSAFCIEDIADVQPIILYMEITSEQVFDGATKIGHVDIVDDIGALHEDVYEFYTLGKHKIVFDIPLISAKQIVVKWYNDCGAPVNIELSYLKQSELLKILDYVDFTMGGNLITSGTTDPDETVTSQYYFRYSESE